MEEKGFCRADGVDGPDDYVCIFLALLRLPVNELTLLLGEWLGLSADALSVLLGAKTKPLSLPPSLHPSLPRRPGCSKTQQSSPRKRGRCRGCAALRPSWL
jgi:hypothetical protein